MSFVHLHAHTEYSMLDGASRISEMFEAVAGHGMPACAITDTGEVALVEVNLETGRTHRSGCT